MYTKITPKVGDKFRVVKKHRPGHWMGIGDIEEIETIIGHEVSSYNGILCNSENDSTSYLTTEYLEPVEEEEAFTGLSLEQLEQMQKIERAKKAINKPSYEQQEPVEEDIRSACTISNTNVNEMINTALENMNRISNDWILPTFHLPEDFRKIEWTDEKVEKYRKNLEELTNPKQTIMNKLSSGLKRALSKDKQTLYKAGLIGCDLELTEEGQTAYVDALFNNEGDHKKAVAEMVDMASEED